MAFLFLLVIIAWPCVDGAVLPRPLGRSAACACRPAARASLPLALEQPTAWAEWSLQSVGVLDGSVLALVAAGVFAVSARSDEGESTDSIAAVAEAEEALRRSVENSPCNGPSIEALEALESADAEVAAASSASSAYKRDPNELPGLGQLFRGRKRVPPSMQLGGGDDDEDPTRSCLEAAQRLTRETERSTFRLLARQPLVAAGGSLAAVALTAAAIGALLFSG
eukprot:1520521-Prymnesium_polylepis.1